MKIICFLMALIFLLGVFLIIFGLENGKGALYSVSGSILIASFVHFVTMTVRK